MKIFVDGSKCSGCRYCEVICSFYHELKFNYKASRIMVVKDDKNGMDYPILCHQCDPCFSSNVCPTQALIKTDLGTIKVLEDKCIKCGRCVEACSFGAVGMHPESGLPIICDLCGGETLCVKKCPTKALCFTDSSQHTAEKGYAYAKRIYEPIFRKWKIG